MHDPDKYAAWIDRARRQVDEIGPTATPSGPTPDFLPGYDIVREIARGGQGVVYLARQLSTKRLVAIKMVREGPFSSLSERIRFEREVEILGGLNHPHIVTIHDSGTAAGCSYYVMDYIDGPSLIDAINGRRTTVPPGRFIRETLSLFADVCLAVHAAHLRGVIHRDLKPSNIRLNDSGQPLVLDFGLAKAERAADASSAAATLTETGQFVGTLNYASPEQVDGDGSAIDVRTDVYALGVMLYELLTDAWPYSDADTQTVRQRFDAILEHSPRRPSARVDHIDEDVDTIVLKCLDKDPDRRYQSAGALAADIRHYLAGEPIAARRDSTLYVLHKNLKRHRLAVGVAALFVALLAGATSVMTVLYGRERDAHERAQRHYDQVRGMAHELIFDMDDQIRPLAGSTEARRQLITTGLDYLDTLADETTIEDVEAQWDLATAYLKVGDIQCGLDRHNLGDSAGARDSYAKARAIIEAQHERDPTAPEWIDRLANVTVRAGDMHIRGGDVDAALSSYDAALALARSLPQDGLTQRRTLGICITSHANALVAQGRLDAGLAGYEESLELAQALIDEAPTDIRVYSDLAVQQYKIGRVHAIQGRYSAALDHYRAALDTRRTMAEMDEDTAEQRYGRAELHIDIGDMLVRLDDADGAMDHYQAALATNLALSEAEPANMRLVTEIALIDERIGSILLNQDRLDDALRHYEASLMRRTVVADNDPEDALARRELAVAHEKVGNVLAERGRIAQGLAHFETSLAIREALLDRNPTSTEARRDVAVAYFKIGNAHTGAASAPPAAPDERRAQWALARSRFTQSLDVVRGMRTDGVLSPADEGIPGMLEERIAECDEGLAQLDD